MCRNPSLGLVTKARACKVTSQEGSPGLTFHAPESAKECEGMNPHTPKWTPCWEFESQWILEFIKCNFRGQNPSAWRVIYIIGKLLKHRCLKWACIAHLDILNISYDQKKGQESNWQFDSWPLKVGNRPNFLVYKRRATYSRKALNEGYNLVSNLIASHLNVAPVEKCKVYYKKEGGDFP